MDYILEEVQITEKIADLEKALQFQLEHDIQVIRGEDYHYMCYIDGEVFGLGLTPMYALFQGINQYIHFHSDKLNSIAFELSRSHFMELGTARQIVRENIDYIDENEELSVEDIVKYISSKIQK